MFDIGWSELLVVGVVSLIVVGPKDLPGMFRTVGRFTGKARGMAREFQSAMNDAADSAGVADVAKDLKNVTSKKSLGLDQLDGVAKRFEDWSPGENKGNNKPESVAAKAKPGSETAKLSEERTEASKKIQEATAKKALERKAAEEAAAKAAEDAAKATDEAAKPAKTPAAKKPAAKKPAAKKTASKKPAAKSTPKTKAAAKPAAKKATKAKSTGKTT